jgi:hypothetical protein
VSVVAWLVVGATSFVSGGFAIPIGFSLSLSPIAVMFALHCGGLWLLIEVVGLE